MRNECKAASSSTKRQLDYPHTSVPRGRGPPGGTRMLVRPESRWKRGFKTVFTSSVLSSSPQPQLWAEPVASFFKILVTAGAGFLRQA